MGRTWAEKKALHSVETMADPLVVTRAGKSAHSKADHSAGHWVGHSASTKAVCSGHYLAAMMDKKLAASWVSHWVEMTDGTLDEL